MHVSVIFVNVFSLTIWTVLFTRDRNMFGAEMQPCCSGNRLYTRVSLTSQFQVNHIKCSFSSRKSLICSRFKVLTGPDQIQIHEIIGLLFHSRLKCTMFSQTWPHLDWLFVLVFPCPSDRDWKCRERLVLVTLTWVARAHRRTWIRTTQVTLFYVPANNKTLRRLLHK